VPLNSPIVIKTGVDAPDVNQVNDESHPSNIVIYCNIVDTTCVIFVHVINIYHDNGYN